jgi:hypothetical protein
MDGATGVGEIDREGRETVGKEVGWRKALREKLR